MMLDILDVLIGLAVVYLIFSSVASVALELIESVFRRRAKLLARGLSEVFRMAQTASETVPATTARKLLIGFYRLAPIASLYVGDARPRGDIVRENGPADGIKAVGGRLPSYIPAQRFAGAVLDAAAPWPRKPEVVVAIEPGAPGVSVTAYLAKVMETVGRAAAETVAAVQEFKKEQRSVAKTPSPSDNTPDKQARARKSEQAGDMELAEYCARIRDLALSLHAVDASDADKALPRVQRDALEKFFDEINQRMTGWYRSYTQAVLFALGLVLAFALNVNSLRIATVLSEDEDLRAGIVEAAIKDARADGSLVTIERCTTGAAGGAAPAADATAPDAGAPQGGEADTQTAGTGESAEACEQRLRAAIERRLDYASSLGLPIGWDNDAWPDHSALPLRTFVSEAAFKLLGWLITALAICIGAPFWFDLINRLINLRSALKPEPEKKPSTTT